MEYLPIPCMQDMQLAGRIKPSPVRVIKPQCSPCLHRAQDSCPRCPHFHSVAGWSGKRSQVTLLRRSCRRDCHGSAIAYSSVFTTLPPQHRLCQIGVRNPMTPGTGQWARVYTHYTLGGGEECTVTQRTLLPACHGLELAGLTFYVKFLRYINVAWNEK